MAKHQFLTEEWVAAAKTIRAEMEGEAPPTAHVVRMNLQITEVPFSEEGIAAFMDTSDGDMKMDLGELDAPDLTVTIDYVTAKAILVDGNPQAGMQAFMAGKVKVQGDMTKMMALQAGQQDPIAAEISKRIQDITAE